MRCEEIRERLVDLLYDEHGTSAASAGLRAHVASCPACRSELEDLRGVRSLLARWPDEAPLRPVVLPVPPARRRAFPVLLAWGRYAAAAAVLLLAFLALANAELRWDKNGFAFRSHLFGRPVQAPASADHYTKQEILQILKAVSDDTEGRILEANFLMMQRMLDTIEQDRWRDLRQVRGRDGFGPGRN